MLLRDALQTFTHKWKDDLPAPWRPIFDNVTLDPAIVPQKLLLRDDEVIYPGRKNQLPPNAPKGSHVFRAFDRLNPADIRAVIIGQDPYPEVFRATGRSFDQGDLQEWSSKTTTSLRKIMQALAYERTRNTYYFQPGGWLQILLDIKSGDLPLETPSALFDYWEDQGVLFLNAGLTLSRYSPGGAPEQRYGHIPFWKPFVSATLRHLAERPEGHIAFLAWGQFARNVVTEAGVQPGPRSVVVNYPHPAAMTGFLVAPGPFGRANENLKRMGAPPIQW
jgi:uracil-DNA glycosylase